MNKRERKVLQILIEAACRPLYGLDIVERSDGVLGRGTVYVTLGRLEDRGYIESENMIAGNIPRRLYSITTEGARAYYKPPSPKRWWQFWK